MRPIERFAHIALVLAVVVPPVTASAQSARTRYESALGRERDVKQRIQTADPAAVQERARLLKETERVIASYEALVRRYPASAYSDNALWQVGELHRMLVDRFARTDSRDLAVHAYRRLVAGYPSSSLVKKAEGALDQVGRARAAAERTERGPSTRVSSAAASSASAETPERGPGATAPPAGRAVGDVPSSAPETRASGPAALTEIQRTVLPEAVRVTLSFDREVGYRDERIAGPDRIFFDLKDVTAPAALREAVLDYTDDVVRKIRVGRHPGNTVRVVLEADGVSRYSVFTLYNPFRVVIDAERTSTSGRRAASRPGPAVPGGASRAETSATRVTPAPPRAEAHAAAPTTTPPAIVRNDPPIVIGPDAVAAARWETDEPDVVPALAVPAKPLPAEPPPAPRAAPGAKPSASAPAASAPVPSRSTTSSSSAPPLPPSANAAGGFSIARQLGLGVSRIVIDPGHGGRDPGNLGRGVTEAEVTLDVALRLEKLLQAEPGIEVVLTRRTDEYIPLEERTAIANRESADLFLSIHANASRNRSARGVETFYLSFASSPDAEAVAARENTGSEAAMHNLPDIVKAIALNNKLDESRDFASMVQESLVARLARVDSGLRDRGVKKAPFVVLIGAGMPSVLAEIAFLSHAQDARLLKTSSYRQRAAEALHAAVLRYRRSLKGATKVADQ